MEDKSDKQLSVDIFIPRRMGGSVKWGLDLEEGLKKRGVKVKVWRGEKEVIMGAFLGRGRIFHSAVPLPFIKPGKKMILTVHGILSKEQNFYNKYFMPKMIRAAKVITVPSKYLEKKLRLDKSVEVVPNPIRVDDFKFNHKGPMAPVKFLTVTSFNFLDKAKGVLNLVEMLNPLAESYTIELTVLGDGEFFNEIKNKVTSYAQFRVNFMGFQKTKKYYDGSHIFVYNSGQDTGPIVLLEAMASGLPSFVNDVGIAREIIKNQENGYIYKSADDFRQCVKRVIEDNDFYNKISRASIKSIKVFDLERIIDKFVDLYKTVE